MAYTSFGFPPCNVPTGSFSAAGGNPFASLYGQQAIPSPESIAQLERMQTLLAKRLGPEYLTTRAGAGGSKLTYIEGWKAIALANEVFGFNGWSTEIRRLEVDYEDYSSEAGRWNLGVTAVIKVWLRDGCSHEDVGYGRMENARNKLDALEKAKKEAITDATKRALRNFGNLMGNCLYDKKFISDVANIKPKPDKFLPSRLHRPDYTSEAKPNTTVVKQEASTEAQPGPSRLQVANYKPDVKPVIAAVEPLTRVEAHSVAIDVTPAPYGNVVQNADKLALTDKTPSSVFDAFDGEDDSLYADIDLGGGDTELNLRCEDVEGLAASKEEATAGVVRSSSEHEVQSKVTHQAPNAARYVVVAQSNSMRGMTDQKPQNQNDSKPVSRPPYVAPHTSVTHLSTSTRHPTRPQPVQAGHLPSIRVPAHIPPRMSMGPPSRVKGAGDLVHQNAQVTSRGTKRESYDREENTKSFAEPDPDDSGYASADVSTIHNAPLNRNPTTLNKSVGHRPGNETTLHTTPSNLSDPRQVRHPGIQNPNSWDRKRPRLQGQS